MFADNRAGNFNGGYVYGIGGTLPDGSDNSVNEWDMGVMDVDGPARPAELGPAVGGRAPRTTASTTVTDAPGLKDPYELTVNVLASRTYPAFRQAVVVAELLPPSLMGDYHLAGTSLTGVRAGKPRHHCPLGGGPFRVDLHRLLRRGRHRRGQARPPATRYDAGSDQLTP